MKNYVRKDMPDLSLNFVRFIQTIRRAQFLIPPSRICYAYFVTQCVKVTLHILSKNIGVMKKKSHQLKGFIHIHLSSFNHVLLKRSLFYHTGNATLYTIIKIYQLTKPFF